MYNISYLIDYSIIDIEGNIYPVFGPIPPKAYSGVYIYPSTLAE